MLCIKSIFFQQNQKSDSTIYFEGLYRNLNNNKIINLVEDKYWVSSIHDQEVMFKFSYEDYNLNFRSSNSLEKEKKLFDDLRETYRYENIIFPELVFSGEIQNLKEDGIIYENYYNNQQDLKINLKKVYIYKKIHLRRYSYIDNPNFLQKILDFLNYLKSFSKNLLEIKVGITENGQVCFYGLCNLDHDNNNFPYQNVNNNWYYFMTDLFGHSTQQIDDYSQF